MKTDLVLDLRLKYRLFETLNPKLTFVFRQSNPP